MLVELRRGTDPVSVMLERLHGGDGTRVAPCSKQDLSKEWVMERKFQAHELEQWWRPINIGSGQVCNIQALLLIL